MVQFFILHLLLESGYLTDLPAADTLRADCEELIRILVASIKSGKGLSRRTACAEATVV